MKATSSFRLLAATAGCALGLAAAPLDAQEGERQRWGFAQNNGTRIYYEEAGNGSPVVMIHGGWLNSRQWDEQILVLSKTHRVIRYDFRGAGRSPMGDSAYSHAEDLAALLATLRIDRAHLIGLSAGSQIALDFVLSYPNSVRSLMIGASPLNGFDIGVEFVEGSRGVTSAGAADDLELLHERIWAFAPFRVASGMPEVRRLLNAMLLHENTWAPSRPNAPRPKPRTSPPATRLAEIRAPVLVVVGIGEMPALVREAEFVVRSIAGAEMVQVEGAGHFVNLEQPAKYNEIAVTWLKRVDAR